MASSTSSASSSVIQNSSSEDDLQTLMDERKRMRMISNLESARRARMRRQKHLDDLTAQVAQLRNENQQIMTSLNISTQHYLSIEAENSVLKAQMIELSHRFQNVREILLFLEPRYQNEQCLDQTPSIKPAEVYGETRHAMGAKTILKDSVKSTGDFELALEPINMFVGGGANDSLFPKEHWSEASDVHYQNEQCLDQTPSIEPAKMFDNAISQGSFSSMAANEGEASEERHATGEKTINVPGTSLKGMSNIRTDGSKRNWAWMYGKPIEGNSNGVECSFCGLKIKGGGITRFKSHISGSNPSKNVKKCKKVPPKDKIEIEKKIKEDITREND